MQTHRLRNHRAHQHSWAVRDLPDPVVGTCWSHSDDISLVSKGQNSLEFKFHNLMSQNQEPGLNFSRPLNTTEGIWEIIHGSFKKVFSKVKISTSSGNWWWFLIGTSQVWQINKVRFACSQWAKTSIRHSGATGKYLSSVTAYGKVTSVCELIKVTFV